MQCEWGIKVLKELVLGFSHYIPLHRWKKVGHFSSHFYTSSNFSDLLHSMLCIKIFWQMVYACKLILSIERIREFVISVQLIIYAKQNGVKYTTISATGTMAQIGWRRLLLGHGVEVEVACQ